MGYFSEHTCRDYSHHPLHHPRDHHHHHHRVSLAKSFPNQLLCRFRLWVDPDTCELEPDQSVLSPSHSRVLVPEETVQFVIVWVDDIR